MLAALRAELDRSLRKVEVEAKPTEVNRQRAIVLNHCREAGQFATGVLFTECSHGRRQDIIVTRLCTGALAQERS